METTMRLQLFRYLALAAAVSTAAISQASAGCCSCGVPCVTPGWYTPVVAVPRVAPYYVVNHGPVYTGPGLYWTYSYSYDWYRPVPVYPYVAAADFYYPRFRSWNPYGRRAYY